MFKICRTSLKGTGAHARTLVAEYRDLGWNAKYFFFTDKRLFNVDILGALMP